MPERVKPLSRLDRGPAVGVALGLTNARHLQFHAGVIYADSGAPRLLHLRFHVDLEDVEVGPQHHGYVWVDLELDDERIDSVIGICRRIRKRHPAIPYGILYDGGRIAKDGILDLRGRTGVGLTCATFVLAALAGSGIDLLSLRTWPDRLEDLPWHDFIVGQLEGRATPAHVQNVASERGCARFRPEEVAAGASLMSRPADFYATLSPSKSLAVALLASELF